MSRAKAQAYWRSMAASLARGERMVLAAEDAAGTIVGTVQVVLDQPENQPHRGDIAKMLVLDTASGDAEWLYARQGWQACGQIPDYALWPDGTPCATTIFFKFLRD
jgi:hypothetical protein